MGACTLSYVSCTLPMHHAFFLRHHTLSPMHCTFSPIHQQTIQLLSRLVISAVKPILDLNAVHPIVCVENAWYYARILRRQLSECIPPLSKQHMCTVLHCITCIFTMLQHLQTYCRFSTPGSATANGSYSKPDLVRGSKAFGSRAKQN